MKLTENKEGDSHRLMRLAKKVCMRSTYKHNPTFRLGAVIFKGKRVFATASNSCKTHPTFGSGPFSSLHSEGRAIMRAINQGFDLRGASIIVYRKNHLMAKPCDDCMALIKKYGITTVIYSNK